MNEYPEVMTVKQLAQYLQIGRNKAYALVNSKTIPSVKVGKLIRVSYSDAAKFVERK